MVAGVEGWCIVHCMSACIGPMHNCNDLRQLNICRVLPGIAKMDMDNKIMQLNHSHIYPLTPHPI